MVKQKIVKNATNCGNWKKARKCRLLDITGFTTF
jgi:hypothetical protein